MQGGWNTASQSRHADVPGNGVVVHRTLPAAFYEWLAMPHGPDKGHSLAQSKCQITVLDEDGQPVIGAEVLFASADELSRDCARTDKAGRAILSIAPSRGQTSDAIIIDAEGFLPRVICQPKLTLLDDQSKPIANTVTLKRIVTPTIEGSCWAQEAMQLDKATIAAPLGSRAPHVGVICASLPYIESPEVAAAQEILQRSGAEIFVSSLTLSPRPSISETLCALEALVLKGADIIVLGISPKNVNRALEDRIDRLRAEGIFVIVPYERQTASAESWSTNAKIITVSALGRTREGYSSSSCPTDRRNHFCAPGVSIRVGHSLRSGAFLAATQMAGFLACLLLTEGLLRPAKAKHRESAALEALSRSSMPVSGAGSQLGRMPIWGGVDFSACVS